MPAPFPYHVGRCVYCDSDDDLSDEHVVPLGLGGTWILQAASCGRCRDITSRIELQVLREHSLALRTVTEMPTRRKGERPKSLRQKLIAKGAPVSLDLDPSQHPAQLAFPIFAPPAGFADTTAAVKLLTIRVASRRGRLERLAEET